MSQTITRVKRSRVYPSSDELFERFDYTPSTGKLIWKANKRAHLIGREAGTIWRPVTYGYQRERAYRRVGLNCNIYPAHRLIWILVNGAIPDDMQIDHIDGDGLNNRLENLRLATSKDQARNQARSVNNASGSIGVRRSRDSRYWDVTVGSKNIGTFGSFREAEERAKSARRREGFHENHGRD